MSGIYWPHREAMARLRAEKEAAEARAEAAEARLAVLEARLATLGTYPAAPDAKP